MKYYLYHVSDAKERYAPMREFRDKDVLMDFLSWHQDKSGPCYDGMLHRKIYRNPYLDYLNMTGNDVMQVWDACDKMHYALRPYMFLDTYGNVVDVREWQEEITSPPGINYYFVSYDRHMGRRLRKERHQCRHRRTATAFRRRRYRHVLRDEREKEYREYTRRKISNLDRWGGTLRTISGSWKDQTKNRYQWQ